MEIELNQTQLLSSKSRIFRVFNVWFWEDRPGFARGSTFDFYRFEPCRLEVHNLNLSGSIQHCLDVKKLVGTVHTACRCSV